MLDCKVSRLYWSGFHAKKINDVLIDIFPEWSALNVQLETRRVLLLRNKDDLDQLIIRAEIDQLLRRSLVSPPGRLDPTAKSIWRALAVYKLSQSDYENALFIKRLWQAGHWPKLKRDGAKASDAAWLLAQHADFDQPLQLDILKHLGRLREDGEVSGKNYAFLYDRVWGELRGKQRYGTQWFCRDGIARLQDLENPSQLNELRATVSLEPILEFERECRGLSQ